MSECWVGTKEIAAREQLTDRGARKKYQALTASLNGTRELYMRKVVGRGGRDGVLEFEMAGLARLLPGKVPAFWLAAAPSGARPEDAPSGETSITVRPDALLERPAPAKPAEQTLALPFDKPEVTEQLTTIPESARPLARARERAIAFLTSGEWKLWSRGLGSRAVHGVKIERLTDAITALALDSKRAASGHKGELAPWRDIQEELRRARGDEIAFLPVSGGTLWKWWGWWTKGRITPRGLRLMPGIVALHDPPPASAGQSKYFDQHPRAAAFLLSKRLAEGLNVAHCYDALCREWPALGEAGAPPSYKTCARLLENPRYLPEPVKRLALEGEKAFNEKSGPHLLRNQHELAVMEWWVLDHRVHDVFVHNTLFDFERPGAMMRLWKTMVYDWRSRRILGFCWAPTPSSATINSAMRMAVAEFGFPRNLYWDRGRDFQAVQRALLSDELDCLLREQRVEITRALPFHARSKPIESWFGTWAKRFDKEWGTAYAGPNPQLCLPRCREAQKEHDRWLAGKAERTPLPADRDFIQQAIGFSLEWNMTPRAVCRSSASARPLPPSEFFDAAFPAGQRPQISPVALAFAFDKKDMRTVQAGGCVQLDTLRYEPAEPALGALAAWIGKEITLRRDPYNLGQALAFDPLTGAFLGELHVSPLAPQSAHGRLSIEHIKQQQRRASALRRATNEYLWALAAAAQAVGVRTELECRRERLLSTGTHGPDLLDAAPGSRRPKQLVAAAPAASPFVDDAVRDFLKSEKEERD